MKVILSEDTQVSDTSPVSAGEAGLLAGARFRKAKEADEPDWYIETTFGDMEKLLKAETRHLNVFGHTVEAVYQELCRRHPPPRHNMTFLFRTKGRISVKSQKYPGTRENKEIKGWVLLPRPFLEDCDSLTDLQATSISVGPVLIHEGVFEELWSKNRYVADRKMYEAAETDGFTVWGRRQYGGTAFIQVNYNPPAIKRREFVRDKAEADKRMTGHFPPKVLYSLYGHLNPNVWPGRHPFDGDIFGRDMYDRTKRGWKRQRDYSCDNVLTLVEFNRKVWNEKWWREAPTSNCYYNRDFRQFPEAVRNALSHVHYVEKACVVAKKKSVVDATAEYNRRLKEHRKFEETRNEILDLLRFEGEGGAFIPDKEEVQTWEETVYEPNSECPARPIAVRKQHSRMTYECQWPDSVVDAWTGWTFHSDEDPKRIEITAEEYIALKGEQYWKGDTCYDEWRLCNWLRSEARALKIKMPPPPKIIISPAEKKRRHKARVLARRKAAHEKRRQEKISRRSRYLHDEPAGNIQPDADRRGENRIVA